MSRRVVFVRLPVNTSLIGTVVMVLMDEVGEVSTNTCQARAILLMSAMKLLARPAGARMPKALMDVC